MRIKKFIHLLILLPLFMGLIVIALLYASSYKEQLQRNEIEIAQAITIESFNLSRLSRDIVLYPKEERAVRQWRESSRKLNALIQEININQFANHAEVMQHDKQEVDALFSRLLEAVKSDGNIETHQSRLNHIENQLVVCAHTLSIEALQLMTKVRTDLVNEREKLNQILTALIVLLIIGLTLALKHWGKRTLQRIEKLRQVTEIISTGNFKQLIRDDDSDELGDFSRAMDSMMEKLTQIEHRVTERTNELKTVNRRFNEVLFALDRSGVGVEIIDAESSRFEYVNACTCEMLGYTENEMLTMTVNDIDPQVSSQRLQKMARSIYEKGQGRFETIHCARDGRRIPVDITAYFQTADEHQSARFITFVTDITERKAFEKDLLKTKLDAENANRAKSVFLANMSHELRTPLNVILGFAQLMVRNEALPDALQTDVHTMIRSGQQLLSLINDVLEISSIEMGHLQLHLEVVNLPNLVASLADNVQLQNRNIWFYFEPAIDLPEYIHTDFGKLRRMIQSLLANAIKFTTQGSITFQVYTRWENEQDMLCIAVTDTGVGISEQDIAFLFKPFFQSEYGMNLGCGTGLGLYISQEYAKLLGGIITVDSKPNVGSTFLITLPLSIADESEKSTLHEGDILMLAKGQASSRILVVDDQPENQHLISELLKQVGFQVHVAANGLQAVQCFQKYKPHFIYMDVRMPEMDGCEATRIIRAMSGGSKIPIVALTASILDEEHPEVLNAGCTAILKKPVEPKVLFETIAKYLNIEYEYEYDTHQKVIERDLKSTDLSVLPEETRQRLYTAAIGLDAELIDVIIKEELESNYSEIARYLQELTNEFQFDFISTLTAPTKG